MILRWVVFGLLLATVLLLQTVIAPSVAIRGVSPPLTVLSVLAVGMLVGSAAGVRYGFLAGLAMDLMAGPEGIIGVSALVLLVAGYVAGMARPFIAAAQLPGQAVVGATGVAVVMVTQEVFAFMLGQEVAAARPLLIEAVVAGLYAMLIAPFICLVVARLDRVAREAD